jgi:hypothetical protein
MTVFAAIAPEVTGKLDAVVVEKYGDGDRYKIGPGRYLVHAPGQTSQQVSVALGAADGGIGHVLILRVTNYAGWHSRDIWEWISTRLEPSHAHVEPPDTDGQRHAGDEKPKASPAA